MSKIRYKVAYDCDGGCDYGGCDKKNLFLLEHNASTDYTQIIHVHHSDEKPFIKEIGNFTDDGISALIKILTKNESSERWNEDDFKFRNEINKWN